MINAMTILWSKKVPLCIPAMEHTRGGADETVRNDPKSASLGGSEMVSAVSRPFGRSAIKASKVVSAAREQYTTI